MKVAILGSGFGLYGYLPAIVFGCGEHVLLPERYRARLQNREDVAELVDSIGWVRDEAAMLDAADALVVTQRPYDQVRWVEDCLPRHNIGRLLLEKPIAQNPLIASALLHQVFRRGVIVRIGYTFRYTPWAQKLLCKSRNKNLEGPIEIEWLFRAHHYRTDAKNWKRFVSMGGGAIRFFGIHLIALLAEIGYMDPLISEIAVDRPDEAENWRAIFTGPGLPEARIYLNSNSAVELFSVQSDEVQFRHNDAFQEGPFQETVVDDKLDRRVGGLIMLCRDFLHSNDQMPAWYPASLELWAKVENVTKQLPKSRFDAQ
jgi:predicted dehydrogenase